MSQKQADAHIASEYSLLSTYFGALARFADAGSTINFAPMSSPLPAGTYGQVTISAQEASYASRLATAMTTLATTGYKAKKIPIFMSMYRDSVAPLIALLSGPRWVASGPLLAIMALEMVPSFYAMFNAALFRAVGHAGCV